MDRWSKHGGPIEPLPFMDVDAAGDAWTDLARNPEGREACGWAEAAVPVAVRLAQFRAALVAAGHEDIEIPGLAADAELRRDAASLAIAAADRGWSADLVDELFFAAATL